MSVPSILPYRNPLLSPKPGPVIESPTEEMGKIEDKQRQDAVDCAKPSKDSSDLRQPDLVKQETVSFSYKVHEQLPTRPTSRMPNALNDFPLHICRMKEWPRTNIFVRSRIKTTRPSSPSTSPTRTPKSAELTGITSKHNVAVRDARRWPQINKSPVSTPRRARRVRPCRVSSCCSQRTGSLKQDFFIPLLTRYTSTLEGKDKGKASESMYDQKPAIVSPKRHKPLRISSGDSTASSEYNPNNEIDQPIARTTRRLEFAEAIKPQPAATVISRPPQVLSPFIARTSAPRAISGSQNSRSTNAVTGNNASVVVIAPEPSDLGSRKRKQVYVSRTPTVAASSSHDFPSSPYSQPRSRVCRSHSKALDGGADAATPLLRSPFQGPKKSFSFDSGLHDVEVIAEQRYKLAQRGMIWTSGKREEINRLRDNNAALRRQITNLRDEFRMLKDVLLQAESHRRWQECVL